MEKSVNIKEKKECCTARNALWYLVFIGFAVNYMIRINLNIAIVSMIQPKLKDNISLTSECFSEEYLVKSVTSTNDTIFRNVSKNEDQSTSEISPDFQQTHVGSSSQLVSKKFDWNEKDQSSILGSFFWLHWLTQIPGGILASKYGTKLVFGISNFIGILGCFAIPFAAHMGSVYMVIIRILQGLACGFAWPAMHTMTARWIPPNERSKFVTAYLGSSIGVAVTYPICGFIIDRWGWETVFYVCGVMGTMWFISWWSLVHDSPNEHPRISQNEKEYILISLGQSVSKEQAPIPWRDILTSMPVWMNVIGQLGGVWGLYVLMTHAPTYFKFIQGWNVSATGLLSGIPHMARVMCALVFAQFGDYLLKTNKMSRSNVRKLATTVCCTVQGVFMICLAYTGCNRQAAIIFFTLAVASHGAVSTGPLASLVDISPNYAGVMLGLVNTLVSMNGFLTPMLVGFLTFQNQTVHQWQIVFWISASFLICSGIIYSVFTKSELQPWNSPDLKSRNLEAELMIIKPTNENKERNEADQEK